LPSALARSNLSVDAVMTAGALAAVMAAATGGWTVGLAAAAGIGLVLGLAMATLTVAGRLNQIIAGIAVSLVGYGLTETVFQLWQPSGQLAPLVPLVPTLPLPALSSIPFLGEVLFTQSLLAFGGVAAGLGGAAITLGFLALLQRGRDRGARLRSDRRRHHRPLDAVRRAPRRASVRRRRQPQPSRANTPFGLAG
jgi:hypothetical protein